MEGKVVMEEVVGGGAVMAVKAMEGRVAAEKVVVVIRALAVEEKPAPVHSLYTAQQLHNGSNLPNTA